jgi:hypothetical protein
MPKGPGDFTIPAVHVGNTQTNAVALRVTATPTSTASSPGDIFMELEAQPSTAYAQSQVLLTLRLFIGVSTGRATLTQPEIEGGEAIVERLGEDNQYTTERGGRSFIVRERRFAIFPQQASKLTIGPATFEAMVIPERGFSRVQRFRSGTVSVDVQPAVSPPPALAGAAWLPAQRVTLTEHWSDDSAQLEAGVPRTRQIKVEAEGLLETQLPDVALPQAPGIRQYADQPELAREVTPQGLKVTRTVSMAVIAQTPGDVTLPKITLPWWNVTTKQWEVAALPERTLTITPSAAAPAPATQTETSATPVPVSVPTRGVWPWVSGALGLGWLATALAWWWSGRAARTRTAPAREPRAAAPARPSERKLLREVQSACAAGDPDAASRALLEWAEVRFHADPPRSLGALASALPEQPAREILDLEAYIYGASGGHWEGQGLAQALAAYDAAPRAGAQAADEPLLPLYR